MRLRFKQVDVFSATPFSGNPAGVVLDADSLNEQQMEKIAKELGLSETAFILKPQAKGADCGVRFFSPKKELDLAGHPTLAVFHVLVEEGRIFLREPVTTTAQETKVGILPVELYLEQGKVKKIMMSQLKPVYLPFKESVEELAQVLGIEAAYISETGFPLEIVSTGLFQLIVPIKNLATIKGLKPNFNRLAQLNEKLGVATTHLFTLETVSPLAMVHSRDFGPAVGILEDPATGTGSGALGAYLVKNRIVRGNSPLTIVSEQGHVLGRPSEIIIEVHFKNSAVTLVKVGGKTITVLEGEIIL